MNFLPTIELKRFLAPWKLIFALAASATASAGWCQAWSEGDRLPDLSQFGLEGELPDLEGKVVLLDFWASWCQPCKASFPAMDDLYQAYSEDGLVVLAVSVDENRKRRDRFLSLLEPSFPVVNDTGFRLAEASGMKAMPTSYLVDRDGTIVLRHEGWRGNSSKEKLEKAILGLLEEQENE